MRVHLGLNTVLFYHYHYLPRTGFDKANKVHLISLEQIRYMYKKVNKARCSRNMRIKESELNVLSSIFSFIQMRKYTYIIYACNTNEKTGKI